MFTFVIRYSSQFKWSKYLFSFYFCLLSFSYGIIKTAKSKKKIDIQLHSKLSTIIQGGNMLYMLKKSEELQT